MLNLSTANIASRPVAGSSTAGLDGSLVLAPGSSGSGFDTLLQLSLGNQGSGRQPVSGSSPRSETSEKAGAGEKAPSGHGLPDQSGSPSQTPVLSVIGQPPGLENVPVRGAAEEHDSDERAQKGEPADQQSSGTPPVRDRASGRSTSSHSHTGLNYPADRPQQSDAPGYSVSGESRSREGMLPDNSASEGSTETGNSSHDVEKPGVESRATGSRGSAAQSFSHGVDSGKAGWPVRSDEGEVRREDDSRGSAIGVGENKDFIQSAVNGRSPLPLTGPAWTAVRAGESQRAELAMPEVDPSVTGADSGNNGAPRSTGHVPEEMQEVSKSAVADSRKVDSALREMNGQDKTAEAPGSSEFDKSGFRGSGHGPAHTTGSDPEKPDGVRQNLTDEPELVDEMAQSAELEGEDSANSVKNSTDEEMGTAVADNTPMTVQTAKSSNSNQPSVTDSPVAPEADGIAVRTGMGGQGDDARSGNDSSSQQEANFFSGSSSASENNSGRAGAEVQSVDRSGSRSVEGRSSDMSRIEQLADSLMKEVIRLRPLQDGRVQMRLQFGSENVEFTLSQQGEWVEARISRDSVEAASLLANLSSMNESLARHQIRVIAGQNENGFTPAQDFNQPGREDDSGEATDNRHRFDDRNDRADNHHRGEGSSDRTAGAESSQSSQTQFNDHGEESEDSIRNLNLFA